MVPHGAQAGVAHRDAQGVGMVDHADELRHRGLRGASAVVEIEVRGFRERVAQAHVGCEVEHVAHGVDAADGGALVLQAGAFGRELHAGREAHGAHVVAHPQLHAVVVVAIGGVLRVLGIAHGGLEVVGVEAAEELGGIEPVDHAVGAGDVELRDGAELCVRTEEVGERGVAVETHEVVERAVAVGVLVLEAVAGFEEEFAGEGLHVGESHAVVPRSGGTVGVLVGAAGGHAEAVGIVGHALVEVGARVGIVGRVGVAAARF